MRGNVFTLSSPMSKTKIEILSELSEAGVTGYTHEDCKEREEASTAESIRAPMKERLSKHQIQTIKR